jgi:hypothetical protein
VSEGDPVTFDAAWAFVPGVLTSPITTYNGASLDRDIKGQLTLTPPFSANFTTKDFYGDGWSTSSLPLQEDKDCPEATAIGPPGP